jgi:hypothetical protein
MKKCKLLDIEMPLHKVCPASMKYTKRFVCFKNCGFSSMRENIDIKKKIFDKKVIQATLFEY